MNKPDPLALINSWLAIEALQPQTVPRQDKLIKDEAPRKKRGEPAKVPPRLMVPFDIESGQMPWECSHGNREVLGLPDDVSIRWYIPIAFIKMKEAVSQLVSGIEPDGPERERASGVAILALVPFDSKGFPLASKALVSSFGWACGEVLAGRIGTLHRFLDIEDSLKHEITDPLNELAPDGTRVPTTRRGFSASMTKLMHCMNLPKDLLERPRVAIRVVGDSEKDPVDILNSFFLRDLHRVRATLQNEGGGAALESYLAISSPESRKDVLSDKAVIEDLVAPSRTPMARWPAPKPAKLVTLQQAAVNAAVNDLSDEGLVSINGPPGTGKTTLLRDVVASVLLERANKIAEFDDPAQAFSQVDLVAEGGQRHMVYRLHDSLRRQGIVVASSNNAAVKNISAELPLAENVTDQFPIRYFSKTAETVLDGGAPCWGLIAAVLGNKSNRGDFVEKVWWHPDWGLEKYFAAVNGRPQRASDEPPPKVIAFENAPTNKRMALERWKQARLAFRDKQAQADRMRALREQIRNAIWMGASAQQALEEAKTRALETIGHADGIRLTLEAAGRSLKNAETGLEDARRMLDGNTALQPGSFARLLALDGKWRKAQADALDLMRRASAHRSAVLVDMADATSRHEQAVSESEEAKALLDAAETQMSLLRDLEQKCPEVCQGHQAGPAFWQESHERIHVASPWADSDFTDARDALFDSAIQLLRAFHDAAARPLKSNLGLIMDHLKGKRIPSGADAYLADLWDSFFLLIPLLSTTFASFDRLMDGMGKGDLGWLIVDEAGQAPPQFAVGALMRSMRAIIIGDPLQIEPVSKVPAGLIRSICGHYEVHPDIWAAPRASVQSVADSASPYMAELGTGSDTRKIGIPLLVHRRCQNPMFSISNHIAYDGLMVQAVSDSPSQIAEALSSVIPRSCWLDVFSSSDKWSVAEGNAVIELLRRLVAAGIVKPNLYLISPFREVADRLRSCVLKSGVLSELGIPMKQQRDWGERNVGTVHTFQGKEAEVVILVLGASAESRKGARNWAGGTPNILNVAATRAKKAFYIVGRYEVWSSAGVFAYAAKILPVVSDPFIQPDLGNQAEDEKIDSEETEAKDSDSDPVFDDAELTEEF